MNRYTYLNKIHCCSFLIHLRQKNVRKEPMDYHQSCRLLGVDADAPTAVLDAALKARRFEAHPDRPQNRHDPLADEKFKNLKVAYDTIIEFRFRRDENGNGNASSESSTMQRCVAANAGTGFVYNTPPTAARTLFEDIFRQEFSLNK